MNFVRIAANVGLTGYGVLLFSTAVVSGSHGNGTPYKKLEDELLRRDVLEVAKELGVKNLEKLHLYTHDGFFPMSHGSLATPGGAFLLLPEFFSRDHLYKGKDRFGVTESVYRALRPNDNVRKFSIAHELTHVQRGDSYIKDGIFLGTSAAVLNLVAPKRFLTITSPVLLVQCLAWCSAVATIGALAKITYLRWAEYNADKKAALLGADFANGGKLLCDKLLLAQKAVFDGHKYGWVWLDANGEHRLSLSNPLCGERKRRIERIDKMLQLRERQEGHEAAVSLPGGKYT